MMSFDSLLAFQNIRIDRSLRKKSDSFLFSGFFGKYLDEFFSDDMALPLRIRHTGEEIQETVGGIHINQVGVHLVPENSDHLLRLPLPKESVINVHADQLSANRTDQKCRDHRGIYPP